jgi:hypothetical protein
VGPVHLWAAPAVPPSLVSLRWLKCRLTTLEFYCRRMMLTPGREVQAERPGSVTPTLQ